MIPAAVGFQCPDCVRSHTRATRQHQGQYGGTRSHNPRTTSIVLIVINAVVWATLQIAGWVGLQDRVFVFLGLNPLMVAHGAWWQLFTSIFTHLWFMHIAMNCLSLWVLGPVLESMLGRTRFLVTYFIAGLSGSLLVYWASGLNSLSVGGSGALFGLMGALLVIIWRRRGDVKQLLILLGLNLVITVVGFKLISWQAHLGGLIGGALIALIWTFVPALSFGGRGQWLAIGGLGLLIVVGLVARTLVLAPV